MFALKEKIFSLFSLISPKSKLLLWAFLFLAVLLPFRSASALCFDANCIASMIFKFLFMIIVSIGNLILQFAFLLLNWVLSENFMPWSYTTPADNPIIAIGWTLTRDLANMSFVVIMIAIGLGTALKLAEFQVQKLLPSLILVALLINFTPVLLGLMLDAANITMNFFLEQISGFDALLRLTESQTKMIGDTIMKNDVILGIIAAGFQAIVLFIIDILSAAIIFAFTALFVMRYVMIWLLVILSPIAFASRILPQTKKMFWGRWWNEFVQWTIIGIPAAFFLYLGNVIMSKAPSMELSSPGGSGAFANIFTSFITSIMPYLIAVMFLYIGFFMALSSSATGADGVIKTVKSGVSKSRNWAQTRGKAFARKRWEESERLRTSVKDRSAKLATMEGIGRPGWGKGQTGLGGWMKRRAADVAGIPTIPFNLPGVKQTITPLVAGAGRRVGRAGLAVSDISETGKAQLEKAMAEADKLSVEMVISKFRDAVDWATKIGYMKSLAKNGKIDEALKKGLTEKDFISTIDRSRYYGDKTTLDLTSAAPHLIKESLTAIAAKRGLGTDEDALVQMYADKESMKDEPLAGVIAKMSADQAGLVSKEVLNNPAILQAMIRTWDGSHMAAFLKKHGAEASDKIEEMINSFGGAAWLQTNNKTLYKYIRRNPAIRESLDIAGMPEGRGGDAGGDADAGGRPARGRMGFPTPARPGGGGGGGPTATAPRPIAGGAPAVADIPIPIVTDIPVSDRSSTPLRVGEISPATESTTPSKSKGRLGFPIPERSNTERPASSESASTRSSVKPPAPSQTGSAGQAPSAELLETYNALVQRYSPQVEKGRSKEMMKTIKKLYDSGDIGSLKKILSAPAPPPAGKPKWQADAEEREARMMQREKERETRSMQREKETEERSKREEKERFEKWNRERKP